MRILSARKYKSNVKYKTRMVKKDIIENVKAVFPGLTMTQCKAAVDVVFQSIIKGLKDDDEVKIHGFGTFSVRDIPEREGVNPATREHIIIPAHKRVAFIAMRKLLEK